MSTQNKSIFALPVLLIIAAAALFVFNQPDANSNNGEMLTKPMTEFEQRDKLLTFGLYVTPNPEQNPIDPPERFVGYHTALDIETFDDESDQEVEVFAVCDGNVLQASTADGYGGVLIHTCQINNQDVTVLYGHIDPASFTKQPGQSIKAGERLGVLGAEKSSESGFTRKHLHLGIHKGPEPMLLGYVQTKAELENYIDPLPLFE